MKIFFVTRQLSDLADENSSILLRTKNALLRMEAIEEAETPELADALLIQEKFSYKDFRYTKRLLNDPFLANYISKLFTMNFDDCATGLLRGLYSNIPTGRLISRLHVAVPYAEFFNEQVFAGKHKNSQPVYLATWRGNSSSNPIRPTFIKFLQDKTGIAIEVTDSWLNHSLQEKDEYVKLILNGKFSLCPAGYAASSFRIYESMALGRCPVIIADDFAKPMGPNWDEFALFYPTNKLSSLHDFLIKYESLAMEMGKKAEEVWNNYFRADILPDYYANSLVTLISGTPTCSIQSELQRWNSYNFYLSNNWTFAQRMSSKLKKLLKLTGI
jgi:hypothetical protein